MNGNPTRTSEQKIVSDHCLYNVTTSGSVKTLCQQCCRCALQHKALCSMLHWFDHSRTAVSGGVRPQKRSVPRHVCKIRWSAKSDRLLKFTDRQVFTLLHASAKCEHRRHLCSVSGARAKSKYIATIQTCIIFCYQPNRALLTPIVTLLSQISLCFHSVSLLDDHVGAAIHARHHQTWD